MSSQNPLYKRVFSEGTADVVTVLVISSIVTAHLMIGLDGSQFSMRFHLLAKGHALF